MKLLPGGVQSAAHYHTGMGENIIGLDIGGANLKAAAAGNWVRSRPFALWRQSERLADALTELISARIAAGSFELALTMTGELCDCFPTKQDGVRHILAAVATAFPGMPTSVWSTAGRFLTSNEALERWHDVAAGNWHALATVVARDFVPNGSGLLIDVGSTTTDIIPLRDGAVVSAGKTDEERLRSRELIYTGARRTPLCALVNEGVCAEFFATSHDAYLRLGLIDDNETDCDTADSRPATRQHAHARLARMLGGDATTVDMDQTLTLAEAAANRQQELIGRAIQVNLPVDTIVVAGSGTFLAERALRSRAYIRLSDHWGVTRSSAACAVAVAKLRATNAVSEHPEGMRIEAASLRDAR